jgi:phosphopantetheine--protein transferase-like protein
LKPAECRCAGIGIDVTAIDRAKAFLSKHKDRVVEKMLSQKEKKKYRLKKLTSLEFSRLFSAKEAYFKACGGTWMGVEGFSAIDIEVLSENVFKATSKTIRPPEGGRAEGIFFRTKQLMGAEVLIWKP